MTPSYSSKNVRFTIESPYFYSPCSNNKVGEIWLVLHGYGQLAEFFLKKFEGLYREDRVFVSPQGIHRFYKEGFNGRVVANWMTKQHREMDILHCNNYLNAIMEDVLAQFPNARNINALGFSQGAATLSRWASQFDFSLGKLVFWGGAVAHDLDANAFRAKTLQTQLIFALGDKDPLLTPERLRDHQEYLKKHGFSTIITRSYAGAHDLDPILLAELMENVV
ncbi:alpha/beta hydrolase [Pleomorphovibrio marinus]|uniref:alpha/beta hydrolase n=1 Tax=Pleomorphovibrio marinus TaxID=2164132 RepID=UPI000E0A1458|nr:alpha/beta hydrolase [Pleomorphovibrio marinus]